MKCIITIFLLLLFVSETSFAQNASIKGVITDTLKNEKIFHAVIYVLRANDSILIDFTRSNKDGSFEINNLNPDKIILLISYPGFADYSDEMNLESFSKIYLPAISMTTKIKLLQEVILRGKVQAIKIKGDTTEYNADSYKLPANASIEDLLKKLPGVHVTKDGQISAQGERVTQVLIDGEEFFSSDPTLVTRNLPASIISKVQVFDKKSDFVNATGLNNGSTTKTINIKLKENKKNGYFGKAGVGTGTNGFFSRNAFLNSFKGKRKFAVYVNLSNTGKNDLITEGLKELNGNSLINNNNNSGQLDTWNGGYSNEGLPELSTAGIHYNNNWGSNPLSLSGDFKIQNVKIAGEDSSIIIFNQRKLKNYQIQKSNFANKGLRNSLNAVFESQVDSLTNLKLSFSGQQNDKESKYGYTIENYEKENVKLNSEKRNLALSGKVNLITSELLLVKNTRKTRRSIIFCISAVHKDENANGYLFSEQAFYRNGNLFETQVIDQYKTNKYYFTGVVSKLTYTEPLSENTFLLANVELTETKSTAKINSFNKSSDGKYNNADALFSNHFSFKSHLLKWELGYTMLKSKYYFISGLGIGKTVNKQNDIVSAQTSSSSFMNLFPNLHFNYKLATRRRISFKYEGAINNPSIDQLQRTQVNIDPLNIFLGNPKLKPAYNSNYKISYFDNKASNEREIAARLIYNAVYNDIIYQTNIDSVGRKLYNYVNANGNRSFSENIAYAYKFTSCGLYISLDATLTQSRDLNIFNNEVSFNQKYSNNISLNLSRSKEDKYDLSVELAVKSLVNKLRKQLDENISYNTYSVAPSVDFYLPLKFTLHTDCNISLYKKNQLFSKDYTIVSCNAAVEKMLLKNDNLQLRIYANDILNKNSGISADFNSNYLAQHLYKVVKRYFLLSLTWNFNKTKTP